MLEALLKKLFVKLEQEPTNDKKSKNGCAIFFKEKILEERFEQYNLISVRGLKDYYDKYVNGKDNSSGEPNTELKNIISQYLGYESYLDFENQQKGSDLKKTNIQATKKSVLNVQSIKKLGIPAALLVLFIFGSSIIKNKDCIVWRTDHYEEIYCTHKTEIISINNNIDIAYFRKITVDSTTTFFVKNKAVIWYGKSESGEMDYFNSRGQHPLTGKELKPITNYIIEKYIRN